MPTPSEPIPTCACPAEQLNRLKPGLQTDALRAGQPSTKNAEWAARLASRPRSVFGNYPAPGAPVPGAPASLPASARTEAVAGEAAGPPGEFALQTAIDVAMARCFLYRFLALGYEDPTREGWAGMTASENLRTLESAVQTLQRRPEPAHAGPPTQPAVRRLAEQGSSLGEAAAALQVQLRPDGFEPFLESYLAAFGHAARGRCPLNEIEYGDIKADPLFQPHRLADLAAFYRAFGLEVADDADERQDHLCLELEFMCVLAAKEAYALEHQLDDAELSLCRDAQKRFLREHLGRWAPSFARRLAPMAGDTALGTLAKLTRSFVEAECALHGVPAGSEDLLLRPVDEAAEGLCDSCNLRQLPPGAIDQR